MKSYESYAPTDNEISAGKKITKEQQIAIKRKLMLKPANWHQMDFMSHWLHLYQQQLQLQQEKNHEQV